MQRVEQRGSEGQRQRAVLVPCELSADEEGGEHFASALGVCLKVPMELKRTSGDTDEPGYERGERDDQQQDLDRLVPEQRA